MGNLFSQQNDHNSKDDDSKNNEIMLLKNKIKNINEVIKKDYLLIQKLTSKNNELLYEIDTNKSYIEELEEFIEKSIILSEDIIQANNAIICAKNEELKLDKSSSNEWFDKYGLVFIKFLFHQ